MASAYDEIKKVLTMLRQGEPITEQRRVELNRVRKLLEKEVATAELVRNDRPPSMFEAPLIVSKESLASGQVSES